MNLKIFFSSAIFFAACSFLILSSASLPAQPISPYIFGQNAWMPARIGSNQYNGKLERNWDQVKESGARIIRFGGIGPDREGPTIDQYLNMIDQMQSRGMEPIIQVSFYDHQFDAQYAADIVHEINVVHKKNIKYWVIGNEPDHAYGYNRSSQVAPYIKEYSSAMKAVDPDIKTIGPETAWYNKDIMDGLTSPGGPDDITGKDDKGHYYIDILSFHRYPLGTGANNRDQVISNLTSSGGLNDELTELNARISNCNSYHGRTGSSAIKAAITEANINYSNQSFDNLHGTGVHSFIGGQYWAEMLSIAMKQEVEIFNFWSIIEGNSTELNIGYLDRTTEKPQPAFYHFRMMAENFSGEYLEGSDNQSKVKSFGAMNGSHVSVMIMNQDESQDFDFTLRLNKSPVSGENPLKLNVGAGIDQEFHHEITSQTTMLLKFDSKGNIIEKTMYKLHGHADAGLPPETTTFTPLSVSITASGPTTICEGSTVTLIATEGAGFTYQWKKDGESISGATKREYEVTESGNYKVIVFHEGFGNHSGAIKVNVIAPDDIKAAISPSGSTNMGINGKGNVLLNANESAGFNYQWYINGTAIPDATKSFYLATKPGFYTVRIMIGECTDISTAIEINALDKKAQKIGGGGGSLEEKTDKISGIGSIHEEETAASSGSHPGNSISEGKLGFRISPNPSAGPVTLELSTVNSPAEVELQIIHVSGRVLHRQNIKVNSSIHTEVLKLNYLPSGIYVVKITEGQQTATAHLIISKS